MKKLLLSLLLLCSCSEVKLPITITTITTSLYENICIYNLAGGTYFNDTCGKYNIGDTIYLTKTKN